MHWVLPQQWVLDGHPWIDEGWLSLYCAEAEIIVLRWRWWINLWWYRHLWDYLSWKLVVKCWIPCLWSVCFFSFSSFSSSSSLLSLFFCILLLLRSSLMGHCIALLRCTAASLRNVGEKPLCEWFSVERNAKTNISFHSFAFCALLFHLFLSVCFSVLLDVFFSVSWFPCSLLSISRSKLSFSTLHLLLFSCVLLELLYAFERKIALNAQWLRTAFSSRCTAQHCTYHNTGVSHLPSASTFLAVFSVSLLVVLSFHGLLVACLLSFLFDILSSSCWSQCKWDDWSDAYERYSSDCPLIPLSAYNECRFCALFLSIFYFAFEYRIQCFVHASCLLV